jgi:hypothetical protein
MLILLVSGEYNQLLSFMQLKIRKGMMAHGLCTSSMIPRRNSGRYTREARSTTGIPILEIVMLGLTRM